MSGILQRLTEELERVAGVAKKKKGLEEREEEDSAPSDLSEMFQQLNVALGKAAKKKKVLIVIDGLSRVEQMSRTSKVFTFRSLSIGILSFVCSHCTKPITSNAFVCSCLLYTSPSPRDRHASRMPSAA